MVCVVPLVALDEFLLRMSQGIDGLFRVTAKLQPFVIGLRSLHVMNGIFSRAISIAQIGVMNFIAHRDGGYQHG